MVNELDRVIPLDRLDDFEVAEGDPDVRGWDVFSSDGRRIGEVDNLLVDTAAQKVRYLDVDLEDDIVEGDTDRHILIPIGYAQLNEADDRIQVDSLPSRAVRSIPAYTDGALTREYETDLQGRFDAGFGAGSATDENFHSARSSSNEGLSEGRPATVEGETRMTVSEEELAVGKQERKAGEVEIDKEVESHHVRENVPRKREQVVVERRPATAMSADARIEEGEVHVPVSEEQLTVDKRTVPKEEIVVRKREIIENETVEADLRRERAEVREEGDLRRER